MAYEMIKREVITENETYCKNMLEAIKEREEILKRESTPTRWNQYQKKMITYPELIEYTSERIKRKYRKVIQSDLELLKQIEEAEAPNEITIHIDWIKNTYWGNNPHAAITDDKRRYFGTASGCGYDKRSAAMAEALNQSCSILKILCNKKEHELQIGKTGTNEKLIGYGSGYSAIPKFKGGVGIESFRCIFENCGYNWNDYSGEKYDMYIITKMEEK